MDKTKSLYPPGDFAIWIIIYIELITFGALFLGYAIARRFDVELFNRSQTLLDQNFGFINTILLISSSYFVVKAIENVKKDHFKRASHWLLSAIGCGGLFIIIKMIELTNKFEEGINLSTNTFFMFYYILTIFHFMHVVLGVLILYVLFQKAKAGEYSLNNLRGLETGASYWHMVDLLWIVLFPLIYILR